LNSSICHSSLRFTGVWIFALTSLISISSLAASLDTIVIDAGYDKQSRIAIVPFRIDPRLAGQLGTAPMDGIIEFYVHRINYPSQSNNKKVIKLLEFRPQPRTNYSGQQLDLRDRV